LLRSEALQNHENINKLRSVEFPRWRMQAGGADIRLDMSDSPLFVYDFAEHGSLASFVRQSAVGDQLLGIDVRKQLVRDVGNGLQALHLDGMAHCDLK
jgi:serine/threonine protein kinase